MTEKRSGSGRGPGRPSNAERAKSLEGVIEGGIKGLADLLERREELADADSFAAILKRDAGRQAEWLAALAENHAGAEKLVRRLFGGGSVMGAAGAFGPLLGRLVDQVRSSDLLRLGFGDDAGDELPPEPDPLA